MKNIKKHKVAYVLTPITFGGSEKVSLNFLQNVDRDKFDIEPIMFLRPWENDNFFEEKIKRLKFESHSIPVSNSAEGELFRVLRSLLELKKIVGKRQYDLMHTHGYMADILGLAAARTSGIPIVSTCHGFIRGGRKLALYNQLDLIALGFFDKVIAVSDSIRNDWLLNKVRHDRIRVIENSTTFPASLIDTAKNNLDIRDSKRKTAGVEPGEILLGYSGRLSPEKGVVDLISALKLLVESGMSIKLVLLGDGPQRAELEDLVAINMMADRVCFAGFQADVECWLAAFDIFVLPSHSEGTPLALLEAMSLGVPCIATAVGGVPKIVDSGIDGILVPSGSPNEICNAVYSLCAVKEKREIMAGNARQKIALKYNINNWTAKIENEYLEVIQAAVGKPSYAFSAGGQLMSGGGSDG